MAEGNRWKPPGEEEEEEEEEVDEAVSRSTSSIVGYLSYLISYRPTNLLEMLCFL